MKHCHFSIVYNELPLLEQKLPFLYKHFDQIIFFDLEVKCNPHKYSDDGSHEYIKNFPDPHNKITLIEKKDLSDITEYKGYSWVSKQKMFAVGSKLVSDDIDIFWCTDMDEFFTEAAIKKVERAFSDPKIQVVDFDHIIFFYDTNFVYTDQQGKARGGLFARIARHVPGRIYGHCSIQDQFRPLKKIDDEVYYHFAYMGRKRVEFKCYFHGYPNFMDQIYNKFDPNKVSGNSWGFPHMHPNKSVGKGVKRFNGKLPEYIDVDRMMEMLNG